MAVNFKDEAEVRKFLDNLGIEYRFGCYSEKNPEVCHLLGDYLEAIDKDFTKASKVYKSNCDDYKFAKSCYKFASYSLLGKGIKRNYAQAYKYFEAGCSLNYAEACLHQGLLATSKEPLEGVQTNVLEGMKILEKACLGKSQNGCYYLSGMYISGVRRPGADDFVVQKDMAKAFKFAQEGCDLGHIYSCVNLSQMYSRGDGSYTAYGSVILSNSRFLGVKKNQELADKYKKMALEMQEDILSTKTLEFGQGLSN
ncbi:hypothetical protein FQR65_LT10811 [Abscondita terminalis]|nr:hypothetical protein FQR65_LT10811 [Abscondita terminalis]